MYDYISVFAPDETDFSHNGLRILVPTSCEITEVLNGEYSLTITHPHDEWGNWKYIRENYIIKAQGQLFRIYRKSLSMSADGNSPEGFMSVENRKRSAGCSAVLLPLSVYV